MLAVLCTRIEDQFQPKLLLRPSPKPIRKDETRAMVSSALDSYSQERLERDLNGIPSSLHHNVFDAVGLGLQIIKNTFLKPTLPKNGLKPMMVER
jgi:hypothetical protein